MKRGSSIGAPHIVQIAMGCDGQPILRFLREGAGTGTQVSAHSRSYHAAEQRDELAPFHSITSSARASSVGGISRPSALADFVPWHHSDLPACPLFRPFRG